jgi:nitroimidazol reductase NimA-like FMN-containing flavoprotein (pyridoxamine 5'-phosphate oxidase superfamily)
MRRQEREILDRREIDEILERAEVCRIALADDSVPYLVTMNYGYRPGERPALFLHSASQGKKLDIIRRNNLACFQVSLDHQMIETKVRCNCGMQYKSVVGMGRISVLTDYEEKIAGLNCLVRHYHGQDRPRYTPAYVNATTVLRLDIVELTGKKCEGPSQPNPLLPVG